MRFKHLATIDTKLTFRPNLNHIPTGNVILNIPTYLHYSVEHTTYVGLYRKLFMSLFALHHNIQSTKTLQRANSIQHKLYFYFTHTYRLPKPPIEVS